MRWAASPAVDQATKADDHGAERFLEDGLAAALGPVSNWRWAALLAAFRGLLDRDLSSVLRSNPWSGGKDSSVSRDIRERPLLSWFRFRLRTLILLVAAVAGLIGGARFLRSQMADVEANAWVGWSQAELVGRFGQPVESYNEDFNVLNAPRPINPPVEPRRTLYFRTRRGNLWIWLQPADGRWVCYHSIWYHDGVVF